MAEDTTLGTAAPVILRRRPRVRGADPYEDSSDPSTPEVIGVDAFIKEGSGDAPDGASQRNDTAVAPGARDAANATKTYIVAADDAELRRILRKELERVS